MYLSICSFILGNFEVVLMFMSFNSRTCIPAEAEPLLNSSGCYPLVNFTRPFCKNHGITLSDFIYKTPHEQNTLNNNYNKEYDRLMSRLGISKVNRFFFHADNDTLIKCVNAAMPILCHRNFPSCEGTKSQYTERKSCRESCLNIFRFCGKISRLFAKIYVIINPGLKSKKFIYCTELPYRNAGDSPECWYNDPKISTGNI